MYNILMKMLRFNFSEKNALIIAFLLNFFIFAVEFYYGFLESSSALLSDSAHNVGDAIILGASIFIVSSSQRIKAIVAITKCFLWALFGLLALHQVYISMFFDKVPSYSIIGWIGFLALIINVISTLILLSFKDRDVNLKSAYICCRNDALGNIMIIIAGFFVYRLQSSWPDLLAGTIIGFIILISATKLGIESYKIMMLNNK